MPDHRPDDSQLYSLALACTRGRESIVRHFRGLLAGHDLTEQQWRTMRAMHEARRIDTTDLCARCCIHKVSMMRILRALIDRGLLVRTSHPDDKRRHLVSVTPQGDALVEAILPDGRRIYDRVLDRFGRDKARKLAALLDELGRLE